MHCPDMVKVKVKVKVKEADINWSKGSNNDHLLRQFQEVLVAAVWSRRSQI